MTTISANRNAATTARPAVFAAIDSERDYQNQRWGKQVDADGNPVHNLHSVTEWLLYMQHYATEGLKQAIVLNDPESSKIGLDFARKVAALGVVCMEQHGAPLRNMAGANLGDRGKDFNRDAGTNAPSGR